MNGHRSGERVCQIGATIANAGKIAGIDRDEARQGRYGWFT
ncbi:MAG: hypothetical protein U0031_05500 [Thermomicrobiales bacterium]